MERQYTLRDPRTQREIVVTVRRDKRLKKTVRWTQRPDGSLLMRIPYRLPWREVPGLLEQVQADLERQAQRAARRTDEALARRARRVNRQYFAGRVPWVAIRWVSNIRQRLGSVSLGGSTHGHTRLSDRIQNWPGWVIDYVIAHEFVHLLLPEEGHSARFWETLQQAYPLTERARGFIQGYFFARGTGEGEEENAL